MSAGLKVCTKLTVLAMRCLSPGKVCLVVGIARDFGAASLAVVPLAKSVAGWIWRVKAKCRGRAAN